MKRVLSLLLCGFACFAAGQIPDVKFKLDLTLNYHTVDEGETTLRWYDTLGRHSTVALELALEPGFTLYVAQRVAKIPNDGDVDQLEEYYVEDAGNWRIGKQYLPFGSRTLLNESVLGARSDTELFLDWLPVAICVCEAGSERQRGVVGRIGTRLGASFAFGDHFGISSTSLALVRLPEEALGRGAGYGRVLGLDYSKSEGPFMFKGEIAVFEQGDDNPDNRSQRVYDVSATLLEVKDQFTTLGMSGTSIEAGSIVRLQGRYLVLPALYLEPMVRYKNGHFYDFSAALNVRF